MQITKSNSSFGNWAIRLSATEIKFFMRKSEAVSFLKGVNRMPNLKLHLGDPCVFCGIDADKVSPGDCPRNIITDERLDEIHADVREAILSRTEARLMVAAYRLLRDHPANERLREAAEELVRVAYADGRGGIVEFRPHEFDDLKDAL